jgi:Mlc titration factor MtfA (ptsG expression regulator)
MAVRRREGFRRAAARKGLALAMKPFFHHDKSSTPRSAEAFPEAWLAYLRDNVFLYGLLPEEDQERLRRRLPRFIAGKFWEGCAGQRITDEVRVTIAAHACLLLLGLDDDYDFDNCKSILVYPGGYLQVAEDDFGQAVNAGHMLGEAHHEGPVVLSWWHACWEGRHRGRGNVVLHEFAHKLAEKGDRHSGVPPLCDPSDAARWESVFADEYEHLVEDAERQRPTLLDPYGAKNGAEFFAVATECFFLRPRPMRQRHPQLYELLAEGYGQDPAEWYSDEATAELTRQAEEQYHRHAISECDAALRRDPRYLAAYWDRAGLHRALGEFDAAAADYTRLLELAPPAQRASAYYGRGCAHWEAK